MFRLPSNSKEFTDRLRLIEAENIYNIQMLKDIFEKAKAEELSDSDIDNIVQDFRSEEYGFDDIYKLKLLVSHWLLNLDEKSDAFVRMIDHMGKEVKGIDGEILFDSYENEDLFKVDGKEIRYIDWRRQELQKYGKKLSKNIKKEVMARLALLEVFTRILPEQLIPELVAICPKYLGCPIIQKFLMNYKFNYTYADSELQERAGEFLKVLVGSIKPDKRKKSRQTVDYWKNDKYYHKLTSYIVGYRKAKIEGRLETENMKMFLDIWKIPKEYHDHFIGKEIAPKDLAIEIMISKGMIKSEKAFRDYQPKVNKLKKKHSGVDLMLILEDGLDVKTMVPGILEQPIIWDLL